MRHNKHRQNLRDALPREYFSATRETIDVKNYPCPNCGKKMVPMTADELFERKGAGNDKYLACKACGIYGRTKKSNSGRITFLSTPADKETRMLRTETHYYFNKLVQMNIFGGIDGAYQWLTTKMGYSYKSKSTQRHIGEFGAEFCKIAIRLCIEKLYDCRNDYPFSVYPFPQQPSYTRSQEDLMDLLREINSLQIRNRFVSRDTDSEEACVEA